MFRNSSARPGTAQRRPLPEQLRQGKFSETLLYEGLIGPLEGCFQAYYGCCMGFYRDISGLCRGMLTELGGSRMHKSLSKKFIGFSIQGLKTTMIRNPLKPRPTRKSSTLRNRLAKFVLLHRGRSRPRTSPERLGCLGP